MIHTEDVLYLHTVLIKITGGTNGIRDREMLVSALSRPFQMFAGHSLYPTIFEKTAALVESLIVNHPFVDGNKRTGYTVMRAFLRINGYDLDAREQEKYDLIIAIAEGKANYEYIVNWLKKHTVRIK